MATQVPVGECGQDRARQRQRAVGARACRASQASGGTQGLIGMATGRL